jgi:hypothetical protein
VLVIIVGFLVLRGERGCDGSHSRTNSEGVPGCVVVGQANYGQVSAGMEIGFSVHS